LDCRIDRTTSQTHTKTMESWQSGLLCRVSGVFPDPRTEVQCQGFIRQLHGGREAIVLNNTPDFPTCLLSPMLSLGWMSNSPLFHVVESGVEVAMKRAMQFPSAEADVNDDFQLIAEAKIKKEGGENQIAMTIFHRGKMDPITRHQLDSLRQILPFRETTFDAAPFEEIKTEGERILDSTASLLFLNSSRNVTRAFLSTKWSYGVGPKGHEYPFSGVEILEKPIFTNRSINWKQQAFRPITIDASSTLYGATVEERQATPSESGDEENRGLNGIDLATSSSAYPVAD